MSGRASALRFWLTGIGGLLVLIALLGLYMHKINVNLRQWPDFLAWAARRGLYAASEPWLWHLILGLILVQLGAGRHQTGH